MIERFIRCGLLLLVVLVSHAAQAGKVSLSDFAQMRQVWLPTVSPSGRYVAAVIHDKQGPVLCVSEFGSRNLRPILQLAYSEERVDDITWINDDRLLVSMVRHESFLDAPVLPAWAKRYGRQISIGRQGGQAVELLEGQIAALDLWAGSMSYGQMSNTPLISSLPQDPEHVLIDVYYPRDHGRSVFKVNVMTGKSTKSVGNEHDIDRWFADPQGNVVVGWRATRDGLALFHRPPGEEQWRKTWSASHSDGNGMLPVFVNGDDAVVLRYAEQAGAALWRFNVREGTFGELLFQQERDGFFAPLETAAGTDVGGVEYFDDGITQEFWDSGLAETARIVRQRLPGLKTSIASISRDGQKVIARASMPGGPITYIWFDMTSGTAGPWLSQYPALADFRMPVKMRHAVDLGDGARFEGFLSASEDGGATNSPLVLFFENPLSSMTTAYNPYVAYLVSRGYTVFVGGFTFMQGRHDYRKLGYAIERAGASGGNKPKEDFLFELLESHRGQICVVGVGIGSFISQGLVQKAAENLRCAVSIAGISDIYEYAKDLPLRRSILDEIKDISSRYSAIEHPETLTAPMLLIHGDDDDHVSVKQSRALYRKLRRQDHPVEYLELPGGDHHFQNEAHRLQIFEAVDAFLSRHLERADSG